MNKEIETRAKTLGPINPEEKMSEKSPPNIAIHSASSILWEEIKVFLLSKNATVTKRIIIETGTEKR
jgi:hypothetical protein